MIISEHHLPWTDLSLFQSFVVKARVENTKWLTWNAREKFVTIMMVRDRKNFKSILSLIFMQILES